LLPQAWFPQITVVDIRLFSTTAESPCFHTHSLMELAAPVPSGVLNFASGAAISVSN